VVREHYVAWRQLLAQASSPLIVVLLLASAVSAAVGELVNATVIAAMVSLGVALSFFQTHRSQLATERLRAMVASTAAVLRDGAWTDVPHRELVVGDVIRLNAGDLVPADARLLSERELHVQEAVLTGESVPVEKATAPSPEGTSALERADLVFCGTSVVSGVAIAVIERTGPATELGRIAAHLATRAPDTDFERGTRQFGFLIMRMVFFLVLFVLLVNIAQHRDPLESLLFAIALAVGLTPEYLPMIMSVTLARGAVHMAKRGVIVKQLASIQNLGSMDILCADKTNTITSGLLRLERAVDIEGRASDDVSRYGALNSAHQTGIEGPLDAAILAATSVDPSFGKVDEVPFDFSRRRLSVVVERDAVRSLVTKGAPESVLEICATYVAGGRTSPFDAAARARADELYRRLSAEGYRVLAVAHREIPSQLAYGIEDERDCVLDGFLAFIDPPLEDVADVLDALRRDGIELKVLSGDNDLVVRHVCSAVGIESRRIVLGPEIDATDDVALGPLAERTRVFARVSPEQKDRIILALKRRGHVVGFLGDGVNDAPSLHSADVGISVMGGVDVAKEAAAVILREAGLDVLHEGVVAGRRAFGNVMKYLLMGTSSSFGNMLSMAASSLFLPFLPMLPRQILLNDFLYDLAQVTIPTDNVDESYVRSPRHWDIALVRDFMFVMGPLSSLYDLVTFGALLWIFQASAPLFQTGWFVESLATQTLVLFVIRTAGNPLQSRPSIPLASTTVLVVLVGSVLPFTPIAGALGFVPLPLPYYAFVAVVVATYLVLANAVKGRLLRRLDRRGGHA
jgi:Mg2+-importing ATPase